MVFERSDHAKRASGSVVAARFKSAHVGLGGKLDRVPSLLAEGECVGPLWCVGTRLGTRGGKGKQGSQFSVLQGGTPSSPFRLFEGLFLPPFHQLRG